MIKKVINFLRKKVSPTPRESPGYAYVNGEQHEVAGLYSVAIVRFCGEVRLQLMHLLVFIFVLLLPTICDGRHCVSRSSLRLSVRTSVHGYFMSCLFS